MVKVAKFFAYSAFFIVMLYLFFPKENLYYKMQEHAVQYKVKVFENKIKANLFSLDLLDGKLLYEGVETATFQKAHILLLGFYNGVHVNSVTLSGLVKNFLPQKIEQIDASYSLLHPLEIRFFLKGDFGSAEGFYEIKSSKIVVKLHPSKMMQMHFKSSLREFKKLKNGVYSYEKSL